MKVRTCDENMMTDYVEFRFQDLRIEEKQEKTKKMSENLRNGKFDPEKVLCVVESNTIIGVFHWKIDDFDGKKLLSTFGSPNISVPNRRPEVIELIVQTLLDLSAKNSASMRVAFDEELVGYVPPELLAKFNLTLAFQNQGYYRDLQNLEPLDTDLTLESITDAEESLSRAAVLLKLIQSSSFDPTAAEDLDDPLGVIEERIAQGEQLERIGGAAQNFIVHKNNQEIGLLLPRYTHPQERRGGMFCGIVPEFRKQDLGRQIHYLGLQKLKEMGALHYRGETFVGNIPMEHIFLANQCSLIPNSNYWEYVTTA
jgi:predicted acetyltransferase